MNSGGAAASVPPLYAVYENALLLSPEYLTQGLTFGRGPKNIWRQYCFSHFSVMYYGCMHTTDLP